jgi:hypothetical protein
LNRDDKDDQSQGINWRASGKNVNGGPHGMEIAGEGCWQLSAGPALPVATVEARVSPLLITHVDTSTFRP